MKENQKLSDMEYDQTIHGVCAWDHCLFNKITGEPLRQLSDAEYSEIQSHGICEVCKQRELKNV